MFRVFDEKNWLGKASSEGGVVTLEKPKDSEKKVVEYQKLEIESKKTEIKPLKDILSSKGPIDHNLVDHYVNDFLAYIKKHKSYDKWLKDKCNLFFIHNIQHELIYYVKPASFENEELFSLMMKKVIENHLGLLIPKITSIKDFSSLSWWLKDERKLWELIPYNQKKSILQKELNPHNFNKLISERTSDFEQLYILVPYLFIEFVNREPTNDAQVMLFKDILTSFHKQDLANSWMEYFRNGEIQIRVSDLTIYNYRMLLRHILSAYGSNSFYDPLRNILKEKFSLNDFIRIMKECETHERKATVQKEFYLDFGPSWLAQKITGQNGKDLFSILNEKQREEVLSKLSSQQQSDYLLLKDFKEHNLHSPSKIEEKPTAIEPENKSQEKPISTVYESKPEENPIVIASKSKPEIKPIAIAPESKLEESPVVIAPRSKPDENQSRFFKAKTEVSSPSESQAQYDKNYICNIM